MSTFEDIRNVVSFRSCRDEVVPRETVGKVLEVGRSAPSPGNVDSLEFIVVESDEKKELLHRSTDDDRVMEAPTSIIVLSDRERMRRMIGDAADEYCSAEAATAIQNMRVVASSEGLATCWISGFDPNVVAEQFRIPGEKRPIGVVLLAYTDNPVPPEDDFSLNETCFYDEYGNQVESFFDSGGWRGLKTEKKVHAKKGRSLFHRLRRKISELL